jgi:hypothetical protein
MTYDELLAKFETWGVENPYAQPWKSALRAAVEATKMRLDPLHSGLAKYEGFELAMKIVVKAIEKELK